MCPVWFLLCTVCYCAVKCLNTDPLRGTADETNSGTVHQMVTCIFNTVHNANKH